MRFIGLNGRWQSVDIRPSRWAVKGAGSEKSKFQSKVGLLIRSVFPIDVLLEDFTVPGEQLYIDFFLPMRRIAVEANGVQHTSFSSFFHGTQDNFKKSLDRDKRKREWCELNNIRVVEIEYDDTDEQILEKVKVAK